MNQLILEDDESCTIEQNETLLHFEDGTELSIVSEAVILALL